MRWTGRLDEIPQLQSRYDLPGLDDAGDERPGVHPPRTQCKGQPQPLHTHHHGDGIHADRARTARARRRRHRIFGQAHLGKERFDAHDRCHRKSALLRSHAELFRTLSPQTLKRGISRPGTPDAIGSGQRSSGGGHATTWRRMKPKQPIETFMPPNILKARAGNYGGGLDAAALRRAETALVTLKSEFAGWLAKDVQRLGECAQAFMRTPLPQQRDALSRASHDLKGQAQTYEFPLVARVAASLCALLDGDFRSEA